MHSLFWALVHTPEHDRRRPDTAGCFLSLKVVAERGELQIPPLRYASVGMTREGLRFALKSTVGIEASCRVRQLGLRGLPSEGDCRMTRGGLRFALKSAIGIEASCRVRQIGLRGLLSEGDCRMTRGGLRFALKSAVGIEATYRVPVLG